MNYLTSLLKELVAKRKLIWELSKADFRKRFVGSYFGVVWMFIQPIVTVLIYWLIFGPIGFKSAPPVPNAPMSSGCSGYRPVVLLLRSLKLRNRMPSGIQLPGKKVVFKVEILPVIKLISCLFVHVFFVAIMFIVFLVSGKRPQISWIQIIYYSFAASMYALAPHLSYQRDPGILQGYGTDRQHLPAVRHVADPDYVQRAVIPRQRSDDAPMILKLNPFYYIAAGYRDSMLTGDWFFMRPTLTVYFWAVTLITMLVGLKVFKRLRPHFSDVL